MRWVFGQSPRQPRQLEKWRFSAQERLVLLAFVEHVAKKEAPAGIALRCGVVEFHQKSFCESDTQVLGGP
jgi:hypothetical protein